VIDGGLRRVGKRVSGTLAAPTKFGAGEGGWAAAEKTPESADNYKDRFNDNFRQHYQTEYH
jgi:hypothetical protein